MRETMRPTHRHRTADVYVRQSSPHPVRFHHESPRRHYAVADRARALGLGQVVLIDAALGRSGTGLHERPGLGSSWPPCVREVSGASSLWQRPAWRGTTGTGTI